MQSRNFRLQRVGDIRWLEQNYQFQKISFALDELVIVDASRNERNKEKFAQCVARLADRNFIPLTAGGGISSQADAKRLFDHGADKVLLNSALAERPELIESLAGIYGSQSLVAALDYRSNNDDLNVFIHNGETMLDEKLSDYVEKVQSLPVGELLLQSIVQDGTGFGFDLNTIKELVLRVRKPLLVAGGAGNAEHLLKAFDINGVSGVVTANLFNFIQDGLPKARAELLKRGVNLAKWDYENNFHQLGQATESIEAGR